MPSELDILKEHGLPQAPERSEPSPPEATFARRAYEAAKEQFDQAFATLNSYSGHPVSGEVADQLRKLIDRSIQLAVQVRASADALRNYPKTFFREGSAAVFFGELAARADEAYDDRLADLQDLEVSFAKSRYPQTRTTKGTLLSHEGYKRGHVLSKHVAWSIEDFRL